MNIRKLLYCCGYGLITTPSKVHTGFRTSSGKCATSSPSTEDLPVWSRASTPPLSSFSLRATILSSSPWSPEKTRMHSTGWFFSTTETSEPQRKTQTIRPFRICPKSVSEVFPTFTGAFEFALIRILLETKGSLWRSHRPNIPCSKHRSSHHTAWQGQFKETYSNGIGCMWTPSYRWNTQTRNRSAWLRFSLLP